ncbi:hypothetical protein N2152v2_004183 [Parachlorella kessleri]
MSLRRQALRDLVRASRSLLAGDAGAARALSVLVQKAPTEGTTSLMTAGMTRASLQPSSVAPQAARGQRRSMFIQTSSTPNPASLMFLPGQPVMVGTKSFSNAREGMASPLAKRLFQIDGITQVFFGSDFVTVTKNEDYGWAVLKPDIFAAITEFYSSGEPVLYDEAAPGAEDTMIMEDDDEVVAMIKELLETRIRPAVQEDGGDIVFRGFDPDSGIVTLKMMGACSGCPSSAVTLKSGIENMLTHYIPEVKSVVEAAPDESDNEGLRQFEKLEQQLST